MDRIERDLAGVAQVLRLSVNSSIGRAAAQRFGVRAVPTFLVFDANGVLVAQRSGLLSGSATRELLETLSVDAEREL